MSLAAHVSAWEPPVRATMTDVDRKWRRMTAELEIQVPDLTKDIALIVPMLILVEGIVGVVAWFAFGSKGGRGARIAAWLGLVTLTLWCGSAAAFVILYLLLFTLGKEAVIVGAVLVTLFMLAMPFGWAVVIRHHGREADDPQAQASQAQASGTQPR